jgi:holo-[acyl-carrier protein] synthase
MRLIGIGIDVVEVDRIADAIERHGEPFLARIFTPGERAYCEGQKRPALHFAARFAAKEAIAKAFGTGIGKDLGWLDMEIVRRPSGEPAVELTGTGKAYAAAAGIAEVKISLTHARDYAAANAVAVGE